MGKLSTPLLHGPPAILPQYLSYLVKSSTFSPPCIQIPCLFGCVFYQSLIRALMRRPWWSGCRRLEPWTRNKIKNIQKSIVLKPGILFQKSNFAEFFCSCYFWERFHPELLRVKCSFKCIQKPHRRTSGGVVVKWSTKFLMMWHNHSSVLFTEKEKTNTHAHTHTHTHIQQCVCRRTKSGEKKKR